MEISFATKITNLGQEYCYKKFTQKQISSLLKLSKLLLKKYKISPKNFLGHSDIAAQRKKDPGEKFPWQFLSENKIGYWYNINKENIKNQNLSKIN